MLDHSLAVASEDPNIEEAYLHVQENNDGAIRFYRQGRPSKEEREHVMCVQRSASLLLFILASFRFVWDWKLTEQCMSACLRRRGFDVKEMIPNYYKRILPAGCYILHKWLRREEEEETNAAPNGTDNTR